VGNVADEEAANDICQIKKKGSHKAQRFIRILCYVTAAGVGRRSNYNGVGMRSLSSGEISEE
jgi:hypothetical protein